METLALDTGALIALARGDQRIRRYLENAANDDIAAILPAPVLAEALRGGPRDAPVHARLRSRSYAIEILDVNAPIARAAGELLGRTDSDATTNALIMATARTANAFAILTSDPDDMTLLGEGHIHVIAV